MRPGSGEGEDRKVKIAQPIVFVVDDDEHMRAALTDLFHSVGLQVLTFGSATELLGAQLPDAPSCLLLDVQLPDLNGLDIQSELGKRGSHVPIVFMTGHGDVPTSVQAMKAGAVDFLGKPFRQPDLLNAVNTALAQDKEQRLLRESLRELRNLHRSLTRREAEVMRYVARGLMNKEIAFHMAIAEPTVKVHRSNLMRKMGAASVADLVLMSQKLDIRDPR